MRLCKCFAPILVLTMFSASAVFAGPLAVVNHSFEDFVLPDGEYTTFGQGLSGWVVPADISTGIFNPVIPTDFLVVPDGNQTGWTWGLQMSQTLPAVIVEGATYVLSVEIGQNLTETYGGYTIQLWAGGVLLAEDNNTQVPPPGNWVTAQVQYESPGGDTNAGQNIEIRLMGLQLGGNETNFDNVRLVENLTLPVEQTTWGAIKALYR